MDCENRINSLDRLRGLAILMVVVYHTTDIEFSGFVGQSFLCLRSGLWTGVDLFFVLSGYLITKRLLDQKGQKHFLRNYFIRRSLRIFPLFYAYLLAVLVMLPWAAEFSKAGLLVDAIQSEPFQKLSRGQAWLWTYTHNFYQASEPGRLPGMGHLWSLAIEEQFYLVWPFVALVVRSRRCFAVLSLFILASAFATRLVLLTNGFEPWAIFHISPARLDGLAVGAFVAAMRPRRGITGHNGWPVTLLIGMAMVTVGVLVIRNQGFDKLNQEVQFVGYSAISCLFAGVVWISLDGSQEKKRSSCFRLLEPIGRISYCIYIVHWPIQIAVSAGLDKMQLSIGIKAVLQFGLVFVLSYGLAVISWKFFEFPLIQWGRRITSD